MPLEETPESLCARVLTFSLPRGNKKAAIFKTGKEPSPQPDHVHPDFGLQNCERTILLFKPLSLQYCVMVPEQSNTVRLFGHRTIAGVFS